MWRCVGKGVGLWGLNTSKAIHQHQYTDDITAQIKAMYCLILSSKKEWSKRVASILQCLTQINTY